MADFLQDNLRVFVVPVEIMDVQNLDIYEQMVYIVLRSFTNPREATAFPSYNTIAKLGRMSRRKAIDCVASLVQKGLIKKEVRMDVTKNRKIRNTSNLYTVENPKKGVHSVHQGSAHCAPEHNHLTKTIRTKPSNNIKKENVVATIQNKIKEILETNGIDINDHVIDKWIKLDNEENILLAIEDTLKRRDIKNVIGYITRVLEIGFNPPKKIINNSLPIYNDKKITSITKEEQKEALDLLLELREINQSEYDKRLKNIYS